MKGLRQITSQIRTVRGLKNKRSSEIFAAITRWVEAGSVKRKKRGSINGYNKNLRNRRDTLDLRAMIERKRSVRKGAFRPRVPPVAAATPELQVVNGSTTVTRVHEGGTLQWPSP